MLSVTAVFSHNDDNVNNNKHVNKNDNKKDSPRCL